MMRKRQFTGQELYFILTLVLFIRSSVNVFSPKFYLLQSKMKQSINGRQPHTDDALDGRKLDAIFDRLFHSSTSIS